MSSVVHSGEENGRFFSLNKGRILGVRHWHYRRDADRGEEER